MFACAIIKTKTKTKLKSQQSPGNIYSRIFIFISNERMFYDLTDRFQPVVVKTIRIQKRVVDNSTVCVWLIKTTHNMCVFKRNREWRRIAVKHCQCDDDRLKLHIFKNICTYKHIISDN